MVQRARYTSHTVCGAGHSPSLGEPAIGSTQGQSSLLKSRLLVDFHGRNNTFRKKRYLKTGSSAHLSILPTAGGLSKAGLLQAHLCLR